MLVSGGHHRAQLSATRAARAVEEEQDGRTALSRLGDVEDAVSTRGDTKWPVVGLELRRPRLGRSELEPAHRHVRSTVPTMSFGGSAVAIADASAGETASACRRARSRAAAPASVA